MRCTLVDTGPLVGLLDERDGLHERALRTLVHAPKPRLVSQPVIAEAIHLFGAHPVYVGRLAAALTEGTIELAVTAHWPRLAKRTFAWMARFAEHRPDFVDAFLVAWHEEESGSRVWTFDSEFHSTWRTSKGKRIKLARES